jgi:Fusaric acid resistance protein-like
MRFLRNSDNNDIRGTDVGDTGFPVADFRGIGRRAQPTAAYIVRLTVTATVAYLIADNVPGSTGRPVLAPLTALLVLQASVYQTLRAGLKKVIGVTAGVLIAIGVSAVVPFSWWLLALLIAGTLVIGLVMRLGDDLLEVPISAMLIFAATTHKTAATGRIVDTLIGSAVGLIGGLIFARLRTEPAREAVGDLAWRLGDLLTDMADGLEYVGQASPECAKCEAASSERDALEHVMAASWLEEARGLREEIERVDDTLVQAEESARLNPRTLRVPADVLSTHEVALRSGLETLEHSSMYLRGLARSVIDSARSDSAASPVRDAETRVRLAEVLSQLGIAIRTYGRLMTTLPRGDVALETQLAEQLAHTRHLQDRLAVPLEPDTGRHDGDETEWPLRGEILLHVDRMRAALQPDAIPGQRQEVAASSLGAEGHRHQPPPRQDSPGTGHR